MCQHFEPCRLIGVPYKQLGPAITKNPVFGALVAIQTLGLFPLAGTANYSESS